MRIKKRFDKIIFKSGTSTPPPIYDKFLNDKLNSKDSRISYLNKERPYPPIYKPNTSDIEASLFKLLDKIQSIIFGLSNLTDKEYDFWFVPKDFLRPGFEGYLTSTMILLEQKEKGSGDILFNYFKPILDSLYLFRKNILIPARLKRNLICREDIMIEKEK